jgi:5-methylcytosine-specific restriction protein B
MRRGNYVSIGWREALGDLTDVIDMEARPAKEQVMHWLSSHVETRAVASRKAGEVMNFCRTMEENDLVLACEGVHVLGVGRVRGPYQHEEALEFPHLRPVEWLPLDHWKLTEPEGLQTTVTEFGKSGPNLLDLEQRLFTRSPLREGGRALLDRTKEQPVVIRNLDKMSARIEGMLARKGQVVLYGPPGTGKTYHARRTAGELAARKVFRKNLDALSKEQIEQLYGADKFIRTCTFHPGFGYEDFVEGLRPRTSASGQLVFKPKSGLFKRLCLDAARRPDMSYFLIIDELNRGDLPRIFGELITVLESDKRALGVMLPVTGKPLIVPPNLYLIGTMNTADRSISLMDTAMRRRFAFAELMPDSGVLGSRAIGELMLGPWLDALNGRLRKFLKRDARNLQVGHSFLLPAHKVASTADLARVLRDEIIPLLEEYCYDDFAVLKDILGAELIDIERQCIRDELFEPHKEKELLAALAFEEIPGLVLARSLPANDEDGSEEEEESGEDSDDTVAN